MVEIHWIKITTDMFGNRKIRHLRKLPEGNNIVLIWVMLLTMAGRCNADGRIYLTENIPYTPKMLADELDFEESTVRLALEAFERLNMVVSIDGNLTIAGWEEYQNVAGLDKVREQNRIRQARKREKERLLLDECHVTVTDMSREVTQQNKNKNKKESKKENINTIPPRNNDTEEGIVRTYRAGAVEKDDFEGVSGDGANSERACGAGEAESRRAEGTAGRGSGNPENGVRGTETLNWRDLSTAQGRLH